MHHKVASLLMSRMIPVTAGEILSKTRIAVLPKTPQDEGYKRVEPNTGLLAHL
jgi:hypothetical protein